MVVLTLASGTPGLAQASAAAVILIGLVIVLNATQRHVTLGSPALILLGFSMVAALSSFATGPPGIDTALKAGTYAALVLVTASLTLRMGTEVAARTVFFLVPLMVSSAALACSLLVPDLALVQSEAGIARLKIPGIELHYVTLGGIAALGLVAALTRVRSNKVWLLVIALHGYIIVLTNSRTPLVDVLVAAAVIGFLYRFSGRLLVTGLALGSIAITLLSSTVVGVLTRGQTNEQLLQLSGRTPIWQAALSGWQDHVPLGAGYQFGIQDQLSRSTTLEATYTIATSDNVLIDTFIETGFAGAALFAAFLVYTLFLVLFGARKLFTDPALRSPHLAVCAAAGAAMCVHAFASGGAARFHPFAVFLVTSATVMWMATRDGSPPAYDSTPRPATWIRNSMHG